jgi:gluconokinase
MLDKIRSLAKGKLPAEYVENFEKDFDEKCALFLGVNYELVVNYVNQGLTDQAVLQSCFGMGHRPSEGEIHIWNEFMRKRGWNDELSGTLESQKKKHAMLSRSEIQTAFQFIEADEGRLVNDNHTKAFRIRKRLATPAREWPSDQETDNSERVASSTAQRRTHHLSRRVGSQ